jgi:hypothetical protein
MRQYSPCPSWYVCFIFVVVDILFIRLFNSFFLSLYFHRKNEKRNFQVDGQKYVGQGKSKKLARIDAASSALRDFIQFKDQQIKNGVIGINNRLSSNSLSGISSNLNNNLDFTSDEHIENTGIVLSSNSINSINDTVSNSINNQTNTLEDENLVKKIQQSLECLKSNTENQNIAWVNRLQSKYLF